MQNLLKMRMRIDMKGIFSTQKIKRGDQAGKAKNMIPVEMCDKNMIESTKLCLVTS